MSDFSSESESKEHVNVSGMNSERASSIASDEWLSGIQVDQKTASDGDSDASASSVADDPQHDMVDGPLDALETPAVTPTLGTYNLRGALDGWDRDRMFAAARSGLTEIIKAILVYVAGLAVFIVTVHIAQWLLWPPTIQLPLHRPVVKMVDDIGGSSREISRYRHESITLRFLLDSPCLPYTKWMEACPGDEATAGENGLWDTDLWQSHCDEKTAAKWRIKGTSEEDMRRVAKTCSSVWKEADGIVARAWNMGHNWIPDGNRPMRSFLDDLIEKLEKIAVMQQSDASVDVSSLVIDAYLKALDKDIQICRPYTERVLISNPYRRTNITKRHKPRNPSRYKEVTRSACRQFAITNITSGLFVPELRNISDGILAVLPKSDNLRRELMSFEYSDDRVDLEEIYPARYPEVIACLNKTSRLIRLFEDKERVMRAFHEDVAIMAWYGGLLPLPRQEPSRVRSFWVSVWEWTGFSDEPLANETNSTSALTESSIYTEWLDKLSVALLGMRIRLPSPLRPRSHISVSSLAVQLDALRGALDRLERVWDRDEEPEEDDF